MSGFVMLPATRVWLKTRGVVYGVRNNSPIISILGGRSVVGSPVFGVQQSPMLFFPDLNHKGSLPCSPETFFWIYNFASPVGIGKKTEAHNLIQKST
jgi:hypothetical protein